MEYRPLTFISNRRNIHSSAPLESVINDALYSGGVVAPLSPPSPTRIGRLTPAPLFLGHSISVNEDELKPPFASENVEKVDHVTQNEPSFMPKHPPLRFIFSGYSLWLDLEQSDIDKDGRGDLDRVMSDAAREFNLGGPIPSPHVTALYGIDNVIDEKQIRRLFRENVREVLRGVAQKERQMNGNVKMDKIWPDLDATGIIVGAEFDGIDGGTMDMAWAEISFATSSEHEALIDALYNLFHQSCDDEKKEELKPRSNAWAPHLSLCYDNPEGYGPNLSHLAVENFLKRKCPTLEKAVYPDEKKVKFSRTVSGISLWKTAGTMANWKCLEKIKL